jgi:adenylyltransferase/sulfurtransferase
MTVKARLEKQELSDAELETYSRQIVLGDIGYDGQLKLRNGKACIIGLGGLGSLIAPRLVGMGIGTLRIVDRDIVSRSDLHRQYLYDVDVVGRPKVEVAYQKLSRLNPDVEIDPVPASLNSSNAEELIRDMDVVLDGLDRPEPRYVVNRTCIRLKIPYAFGAAIQAFGNLTTIVPGKTLCLECFMSGLREEDLPKCGVVGVHPSVLGIVTAIQTSEAVRLLMGQEPKLLNRILYINLAEMNFDTIELAAQKECPVCGIQSGGAPEPMADRLFEETCARDGRRNFIITPKKRIEIDFEQLRTILDEKGFPVKTSGPFGVTFEQSPDVMTCILKSGIMITQTSPRLKNNPKDDVLQTYRSILIEDLGLPAAIVPEE